MKYLGKRGKQFYLVILIAVVWASAEVVIPLVRPQQENYLSFYYFLRKAGKSQSGEQQ